MKETLEHIIHDLPFVKVESCLMLGSILLLIAGLIRPKAWIIKGLFGVTLSLGLWLNSTILFEGPVLTSSLFLSPLSSQFSLVFLLGGLLLLVFNRAGEHATEFYFLSLSVLIGSFFMMKANSLLVIYLGVELTSFASYLLTNFSFKKGGFEAAIKYLIFGGVSSAIMLLGLGVLYGTTGSFYLDQWDAGSLNQFHSIVGLGLMLAGLFFKASIFPFHIWVPATYQSAPTDAVALISTVPKLAALLLIKRVLMVPELSSIVNEVCLWLGILTMVFGTFAALRQSQVRRMISFGAVAHSGFLLPFVLIHTQLSDASFWWYSGIYLFMNFGIFYLIDFFERNEVCLLEDYAGLGAKTMVTGASMTVICLSLVGLPPVAGFTAKFLLFSVLWEHYLVSSLSIFAVYLIVAVFITVVSLFFYLKIPYQLFLVKSEHTRSINGTFLTKIIATLFSIGLLLFFFAPQIVTSLQRLLNYTSL